MLQNSRAVKKVELLRIAESLEVWNKKVGVASEGGCGIRRWVWHQKVGVASEGGCGIRRWVGHQKVGGASEDEAR